MFFRTFRIKVDAPPTPHIFFLIELANPDRLLYLPDLSIASAKEHHSSDQPVQQDFRFLSSLNNNYYNWTSWANIHHRCQTTESRKLTLVKAVCKPTESRKPTFVSSKPTESIMILSCHSSSAIFKSYTAVSGQCMALSISSEEAATIKCRGKHYLLIGWNYRNRNVQNFDHT